MRVCFLTHYFPPEVGAPQTRIELLALTLAADGAEVTVHTGFPHYPDGGVTRAIPEPPLAGGAPGRDPDRPQRGVPGRQPRVRREAGGPRGVRALGAGDISPCGPRSTWSSARAHRCSRPPPERSTPARNGPRTWSTSPIAGRQALSSSGRCATAGRSPPRRRLERWVYRHADLVLSPTEGIATTLAGVPDAAGKSHRVWPVVDLDRFDASDAESAR